MKSLLNRPSLESESERAYFYLKERPCGRDPGCKPSGTFSDGYPDFQIPQAISGLFGTDGTARTASLSPLILCHHMHSIH